MGGPHAAALPRAPHWLPGGNLQTIWPVLCSRRPADARWRRERWDTPDGDFIDVDFVDAADAHAPLLVLLHGLEGSSQSHYARSFAHWAEANGWRFAVPHWRGCSGELNLAPRAYHSGDYEEVDWLLTRLRGTCAAPLHVVGVSLGGNALLRWAAESGELAATRVRALASVSAPLDLAAGGAALGRGFNRLVYGRMFLQTMHAVRVRQRVHGAAARLCRHRRLLVARVGQAAPGAHPRADAGTQRTQRPVRAGPQPAARRQRARHAVAAGARRPRGLSRRRIPRPPDDLARCGDGLDAETRLS
jgi:predicted alpha/beta-fold hydrolase